MKACWCMVILFYSIVLSGCSGITVSQDYNPSKAFFSDLKTYAFLQASTVYKGNLLVDDPLLEERIVSAMDRWFLENGYEKAATGRPDFFITYKYSTQTRIESDGMQTRVGFGIGTYGSHGGIGFGTGDTIWEYDEGRLIIDFTDNTKENLIWRGIATSRLPQHSTPEKRIKHVNETVAKILNQFPPKPH